MAVLLSNKERATLFRNIARMYKTQASQADVIGQHAESMRQQGYAPTAIETQMASLLTDLESQVDEIQARSAAIDMTFRPEIRIGCPARHTAVTVKQLRRSTEDVWCLFSKDLYVNWTGVVQNNDIIQVEDAMDSGNDGFYKVTGTPNAISYDGNQVTNGTFDADASWTKGTGWTITGGKAVKAAGSASNLSQAFADMSGTFGNGAYYLVYFTTSTWTAGTITVDFLVGAGVYNAVFSTPANTTHYALIQTNAGGSTDLAFQASSTFDGSIDNVVMRPFGGLGISTTGIYSGITLTARDSDTKMKITVHER